MEDNRIIDGAMPHPDQEEVKEKEYTVNLTASVLIQVDCYGSSEEEAAEEAIRLIRRGRTPFKIVDKDLDSTEVEYVEER